MEVTNRGSPRWYIDRIARLETSQEDTLVHGVHIKEAALFKIDQFITTKQAARVNDKGRVLGGACGHKAGLDRAFREFQ